MKESRNQAEFLDFSGLTLAEKISLSKSPEKRQTAAVPITKVTKEQVLKVEPMKWWEELICVLFLAFGVPNGAITIPIVTTLWGYFVLGSITRAFAYLLIVLVPLAILPQSFVPATLHSELAHLIAKYFSFRFAYEDRIMTHDPNVTNPNKRPQILVAPPHGVFPYGNILSMLVWPSLSGHHFIGLASSAALRPPLFKQILRSIGVVDADRHTAQKQLEQYPYTIGISTGGVAEVFVHGDEEVILLKERVGLIKLALRTGADLVPCYVFGNTQVLLSWWFNGVESLSRKLGFALIIIYGRYYLPIPLRVPIFGVKGKPIPTEKCDDPSPELIKKYQDKLIAAMQELFDNHKALYGWEHKTLIIQ